MRIVLSITICFMTTFFHDQSAAGKSDSWYPENYDQGRSHFREAIKKLAEQGIVIQQQTLTVPSQKDTDLEIDVAYIKSTRKTDKVVLMTSGVHGAEAFAGSAIQTSFLNHQVSPEMLEETSLVFIHAVNPYGFRYVRRVTENNVDLNRNFAWNNEIFEKENLAYVQMSPFLNPERPVEDSIWKKIRMFFSSMAYLSRMGKKKMRQAAIGGQYTHDQGIFFGGRKPEPNVTLVQEVLKKWLSSYEKIFHIDLHTGYGERGKLHLFSTNLLNEKSQVAFDQVFKGLEVNRGGQKDFYMVSGDITQHTVEIFSDKIVIPMTFEMGTQNSQTILGGFFSLRTMVLENQGHHHGFATEYSRRQTDNNFRALFNPPDEEWRNKAARRSQEMFDLLLPRFFQQ